VKSKIPFEKLKREEFDLIDEIVTRALDIANDADVKIKKIDLILSISACHLVACPLDLYRLFVSDVENFTHDVFGIHRHLNRESLQMNDCFSPRFAKREEAA
jgi:hypothetical protein